MQGFDRMDTSATLAAAVGHTTAAELDQRREPCHRSALAPRARQQQVPGVGRAPRTARRAEGAWAAVDVGNHEQVPAIATEGAP